MDITTRDHKRASVIRITGRVDSNTSSVLDAKLKEYISANKVHIVLEMDETDFISSAGVRALISAQKAVKPRGGQVVLAKPSEKVRDVLKLAALESLFPVYETTEDAVGAI
ncbi:MAG TPA: STAS domain-containing protein [Anaerolineales bacterium]|nr:STAS domain-containing protein [Anaerolineales bacterium]